MTETPELELTDAVLAGFIREAERRPMVELTRAGFLLIARELQERRAADPSASGPWATRRGVRLARRR